MNYILVMILLIVIVVIIVGVVLYLKSKSKVENIDVNILNSVYGTDGYYIYYVPLIEVFSNLVKIANIDPNYIQIEDGSEYKLVIKFNDTLNYVGCSLMDGDIVCGESDFEMKWIDTNETMTKKITVGSLYIGHNKNVEFSLEDGTVNVKNKSWSHCEGELKFKYDEGLVVVE